MAEVWQNMTEATDLSSLSEEDKQAFARITEVFAALVQDKTYHGDVAVAETPDLVVGDNVDADDETTEETETTDERVNERVDQTKEAVANIEKQMAVDLLGDPSLDNMHDVIHMNEEAFNSFLNMAEDNQEQAQNVMKEYYKAMNGELGNFHHVEK